MTVVATDPFEQYTPNLSSPAFRVAVVTPNDTDELATVTRAIRCENASTLAVKMVDGSSATLKFSAGETRWVRVRQILSTGTTSTGAIECMS